LEDLQIFWAGYTSENHFIAEHIWLAKQKLFGFQNLWKTRKHGALQGGGVVKG
jgi:hypothetical protein